MCIVAILLGHPRFPLIVLNNREESIVRVFPNIHVHHHLHQDRPTVQAAIRRSIVTPVDLDQGGTWIGLNIPAGIFTVLTNLEPESVQALTLDASRRKSRGLVTKSFLKSRAGGESFLESNWDLIQGFNLVAADLSKLCLEDDRDAEDAILFTTNRAPNSKDPIPWDEFRWCPLTTSSTLMKSVVFTNLDSFYYDDSHRTERNSSLTEKMKRLRLDDEDDTLFAQLAGILSESFEDIWVDDGITYKTRTQTILMVGKDGSFQYCHRNTDEMDRATAIRECRAGWETITGKIG